MKKAWYFFVFVSCWFLPRVCDAQVSDEKKARECIERLIAADNVGDLKGVLNSYHDNAELWPPHGGRIIGKATIQKNYENIFAKGKIEFATRIVDVIVSGNYATITGYNSGKNIDGKYFAIVTKDSVGEWRILKLIWNDNK